MLERVCNFNRDKIYSPCIDRIRNKLVVLTFNFSKKPLSITVDKTIISSTFPSDTMIPKNDDKYVISNYIPASILIYFYDNVTKEKLVTFMKNFIKICICVTRIRLCNCLHSSSCCFPANRRNFVIVNRYS